jgi:glycosyltransferase involved in cell wall biosynthesis
MKILHVLPSLDQRYGGPLRAVLDLSAHSRSMDFESELLGFGPLSIPDNPLPRELIHSLGVSFPKAYCYSRELVQWLSTHLGSFDGVVLHGMWLYPNWAVSRACRLARKPYVYFPHGMLEPWSVFGQGRLKALKKILYWHLLEKRIFRDAAAAVFTTHRELQLAHATLTLPTIQSSVVPYGVAVNAGQAECSVTDPPLFPKDQNFALFLGRLHPKKNVEFLIRAWAEARPDSSWRLIIAGPGATDYVSRLKTLANALRVEEQVTFLPMVTGADKMYLLQHAKWFILPSQQENFGNAVLEAIQYGCPTVVSDQVHLTEFFHDGAEVLPLNHAAWVEFIRHRMTDESRRREIIEMDQTRLRRQFEITNLAQRWAEHFTKIFSSPRPAAIV